MIIAHIRRGTPCIRNVWKTLASRCVNNNNTPFVRNVRLFSSSKLYYSNYEGDGKTTVSLLNREYQNLVLISSISTHGFRLNNGLFVFGPVAVFPRTVLQWNVSSVNDINPETLSLFCVLQPKIDILVIGTGDKSQMLSKEAINYLKLHKISPEILSTENAIATFNYLNVEGRCVAGAFICPTDVKTLVERIKLLGNDNRLESLWEEDDKPVKKIES